MSQVMWNPSEEAVTASCLQSFIDSLTTEIQSSIEDYHQLYDWSVANPEKFWAFCWKELRVKASKDFDSVLTDPDQMPGAKWFEGARLNFAENLLQHTGEQEAIVSWDETGSRKRLTFDQLRAEVTAFASAMRQVGIGVGDRVAGVVSNRDEAIIAMLAATSIGAIWSSCSPDFEVQSVLDRFGQIEPKLLFVMAGYDYKGKWFDTSERASDIVKKLPSVEKVVYINHRGQEFSGKGRFLNWDEFRQAGIEYGAELEFEQLPADHPVYIMFSSGTTGVPKCMVHGAAGTLIEHFKEHVLHTDEKPGDRVFYATTCGWMMWNWLVSALGVGATVVLYDGFPFARDGKILFDLIEQEKLKVFGTSAGFISAAEKMGLVPQESHNLESLQSILSTGSPLVEENYDYIYSRVKPDVKLCSISGGTDIIGCFALGCPTLPIHRGELQVRSLGLAVDVWSDDGESVVGERGELVCKAPFPSMPVSFWNDPESKKYSSAYFEYFPGVWRHGDYAILTENKGMIILGRSDATLNPGGVRIGTAEIYRAIERIPEIKDSVVIGHNIENDQQVVLFVEMQQGMELTDDLRARIKAEMPSPRHRPAVILDVPEIPVTRSGKKVEIAVRQVVHGETPKNTGALANPEALESFKDRL